jgi:uncharacterized protein (DUF3084 family)
MFGPDIRVVNCCSCDCEIWFRPDRIRQLRETKQTFYCQNGHAQSFRGPTPTETENADLKKKLESAERDARLARERAEKAEARAKENETKCSVCKKKFASRDKLAKHTKRVHKPLLLPAEASPSS